MRTYQDFGRSRRPLRSLQSLFVTTVVGSRRKLQAMASKNVNTLQLIDGKGSFNSQGLESFVRSVRLAECGLSYAVVAIVGPQSSGKSTLMNHLFKTKFVEMDAYKGRSQTTQGVWMARAEGVDPCTLVMDLEGTDGRERGEDDTTFEKQSSLFALAVSDIVLINMWCHDIGREQAANKPLLKTVFQVMMRLFTPRRTTLLFVIRDKTRTPLETLEPILREDIQKIWDIVPKPLNHQHTPLSEFFNVQVTALVNYEEKEDEFKKQVAELRERFQNSVARGGLAGDRRAVVPATGFPFSTQEIWKVIKENKDLDLPAHKVMVATVRCEEIADEKLRDIVSDKAWVELEQKSREDIVIGFGKSATEILRRNLHEYDLEAAFFEEGVRTAKRNVLTARVLDLLQPSFQSVLMHHCEKALSSIKNILDTTLESSSNEGFAAVVRRCTEAALSDFDHGCSDAEVADAGWDTSKTREGLRRDIETYVHSKRQEKLSEVESTFEKDLETAVGEPTCSLLDAASPDTWPAISKLLEHEVQVASSHLSAAIAGFEPSGIEEASMLDALSKHGRSIVEKKAREEAGRVVIRMKDRFTNVFVHEADNMPRMWGEEHDVRAITRDARVSALKLLAVLAALRLDVTHQKTDTIESSLMTLVGDAPESSLHRTLSKTLSLNNSTAPTRNETTSLQALAVSTWPGIPQSDTLLTPVQCKSLWRRFQAETEYSISQALAAQDAAKRGQSWLPPPWAMCAMVVLGFNEFMALLRNPLYIAILFVLYLAGKATWVQLDITREFQYGFLPGLVSVASKLLPTVMNVLKKLVDDGHRIGSEGSSNLNHANGTTMDRDRPKEMYDIAGRGDSSSSGLSENGVNVGGKLRQREPVRVA